MERLYERCSTASVLCVRLTLAAQVYGGSLSLVIGAYLWGQSQQYTSYSTCSAGVTVVTGLVMELNNSRISGSRAGTYNMGGAMQPHSHTFRLLERLCTLVHVTGCAHSSRKQIRR